jgi:hypothetical protein
MLFDVQTALAKVLSEQSLAAIPAITANPNRWSLTRKIAKSTSVPRRPNRKPMSSATADP